MTERLIVGLGNPGLQYARTRHNAGFLLLDDLIDRYNARAMPDGPNYLLWTGKHDNKDIHLMKPLTYMNLSGEAVSAFMARNSLEPDHILIAYDDVALPLGKLRLRATGSAGGQKGMRHIIDVLGSMQISRLRVGISSSLRGGRPLPDFVLEPFAEEEWPLLDEALTFGADAVSAWIEKGIETAMGEFNGKKLSASSETSNESSVSINGGD